MCSYQEVYVIDAIVPVVTTQRLISQLCMINITIPMTPASYLVMWQHTSLSIYVYIYICRMPPLFFLRCERSSSDTNQMQVVKGVRNPKQQNVASFCYVFAKITRTTDVHSDVPRQLRYTRHPCIARACIRDATGKEAVTLVPAYSCFSK